MRNAGSVRIDLFTVREILQVCKQYLLKSCFCHQLWKYQEGIYTHMGLGHAGAVTCCRFSPDSRHIVSCCAAGTIIVWKVPEVCHCSVSW